MKLYAILGCTTLFLLSESMTFIVLSLVRGYRRGCEKLLLDELVIVARKMAIGIGIGLIAVVLWVLGV